jgi:hypothetical protein
MAGTSASMGGMGASGASLGTPRAGVKNQVRL